jgi:hypothetical protein
MPRRTRASRASEERQIARVGVWAIATDGIQWIVQRYRGHYWRPLKFVRSTKTVLARCLREAGATAIETDADNVDYKIEAAELLRRHEAPRVMSESIRPTYRENDISEAARIEAWRKYEIAERELKIILATKDYPPPPRWDDDLRSPDYLPPAEGWPGPPPEIPLKDLVVARRARQNRLEREQREEREREAVEARSRGRSRNGNGTVGNGSASGLE